MEDMDEFESPEYDSRKLTEEQAKRRKRTQALRKWEVDKRELEESRRITTKLQRSDRKQQRHVELQREIRAMDVAYRKSNHATNVYQLALAHRKQRIEEHELLLSLASSDEEKLEIQSDFDDFMKVEVTFTPTYYVELYAEILSRRSSSAAESQKQEHSLTRRSTSEDAKQFSPDGKEEKGQAESIYVKPTEKSRRK